MDAEVKQTASQTRDATIEDEWYRETDDQILGVNAWKPPGGDWRVLVSAAELLTDEPLQSRLFESVEAAISSVPGVSGVWHEDREQWVAEGSPEGPALVRAVSGAVDGLADEARRYVEGLR